MIMKITDGINTFAIVLQFLTSERISSAGRLITQIGIAGAIDDHLCPRFGARRAVHGARARCTVHRSGARPYAAHRSALLPVRSRKLCTGALDE